MGASLLALAKSIYYPLDTKTVVVDGCSGLFLSIS